MTGGLHDMWFAIIVSPQLYVSAPFGFDRPLQAIMLTARRMSYFAEPILAGMVLAVTMWRHGCNGQHRIAPFLLPYFWAVGAVLAAASAGYFRYYYFIALIPPMTVIAAMAVERALSGGIFLEMTARHGRPVAITTMAVFVLAAYPLAEHIRKLPHEIYDGRLEQQLISFARGHVLPGQVAFFGDLNAVLYPLTGTVPATRFPQAIAHVFDLPEKFGVDPIAELNHVFDRKPVLVMGTPSRIGPKARYGAVIAARLAASYDRVKISDPWLNEHVLAYRPRDIEPQPAEGRP
jgi:hypothetical protein